MIALKNVTFRYSGQETDALSDCSLTVQDGECVLLCGKSGCGKTTVTRLLNGMIPEFYDGDIKGTVTVGGIDPTDVPMYEISKRVGTVFQNPRTQFYTVNTTSEIAFGCENHGFPPDIIQKRVDDAAEKMNLSPLLDRNIFNLSGGEKHKIAFAGIYAVNPDLYILDEPSSNLDYFAIRELRDVLRFLKSTGKTIVIAEHRVWYLAGIADRAVCMESGRIMQTYTMPELHEMTLNWHLVTGIRPVEPARLPLQCHTPAASGEQMELSHFSLSYGRQKVLDIPQAVFPAGQVFAVIGKNGAGKTTFVSALCGLLKHQRGKVMLGGKAYSRNARIAMSDIVMQEVNHQLFTDSVAEEVLLGAQDAYSEKELTAILERLDISALRDRHPMTLSGGQKQRVAIASALFCRKKILIFDEPTSGMDFTHMMQTAELLRALRSENRYIFVITHDYELILSACDAVVRIENGQIAEQYPLNENSLQRLQDFYDSRGAG